MKPDVGYDFVIVGLSGESPSDWDAGTMSEANKGVRVRPSRKCMNQPTTICETPDGRKLWVDNEGLTRVSKSTPAVGVGMFWCGCSGKHEDHLLNDSMVLRILGHVLAVQMNAVKFEAIRKGLGFEKGFLRDRAPGPQFAGIAGGIDQVRRTKKWPCTGFMCSEANVAAYCALKGWLEFNDDCTGSRITEAGIAEHTRLFALAQQKVTKKGAA